MEVQQSWLEQQQSEMESLKSKLQNSEMKDNNEWYQDQMDQNKVSLIRERLDVNEIYEMIEHYLRGDVLESDGKGNYIYVQKENLELSVLTEYGIQLIMSTLKMYINRNTLMSNYDERTINYKMLKFTKALNRTIFMEYEKIFKQPSSQECFKILDKKIKDKVEVRMYVGKLLGRNYKESEVEQEIKDEMEDFVDREIEKIREQTIVNKYKRYLILMRSIQDAVHSTYLRALNGQERRSIGQTIHISENIGTPIPQQQKSGGFFGLWGNRQKRY